MLYLIDTTTSPAIVVIATTDQAQLDTTRVLYQAQNPDRELVVAQSAPPPDITNIKRR